MKEKNFSRLKIALAVMLFSLTASRIGWTWSIQKFDATIKIHSDSRITVEETITADFTTDQHHGLYRFIPTRYTSRFGQTYRLRVHVEEVKSSNAADQYWTSVRNGQLHIRIGNPNVYYREIMTYTIRYTIENVLQSFPTHEELYWNVTGNEWNTRMDKVHLTVLLPNDFSDESLKYAAFLGLMGSHNDSSIRIKKTGPRTVEYEALRPLSSYEGLTVVLGLPKGSIRMPSGLQRTLWFLTDNWPYGICVFLFFYLFASWWKKGRDPSGRGSIVVQYEPPTGLSPGEVGTLIDEKVDMRDITAGVLDLAVRGYLTIEEEEDQDFLFKKKDDPSKQKGPLKNHEKILLDAIFSYGNTQRLSSLKNKFYVHVKQLQRAINDELVKDGFFKSAPQKIRAKYRALGGCVILAGIVFFFMGITDSPVMIFNVTPLVWLLTGLISGLLFFIFAPLMPQKTEKGAMAFEHIKGLEEYIARAEAAEIQKVDIKERFEKLLPYAMCFDLTKAWSKAFASLYTVPPQWYSSPYSGTWNTMYFSQSLNRMQSSTKNVFTSVPRTSGGSVGSSGFSGGSSGGGFGGGGGGAW
jgi:uncharacterized membrane protein